MVLPTKFGAPDALLDAFVDDEDGAAVLELVAFQHQDRRVVVAALW